MLLIIENLECFTNVLYFLYLFDTKYSTVNQMGSTTVVLKVRNIAGGEENCLGSGD